MNPDLLLDNLTAIAAGPGGVDRLRELILELAISGKLIPQKSGEVVKLADPHTSAKKGKRRTCGGTLQTPSSWVNHLSSFNIPDSWRLVEFERVVAEIKPGFAAGMRDTNGIAQLRMNNVNTRGGFNWSKIIRIPVDQVKNIEDYYLVRGDILFNNTNSSDLVGKSAVFDAFTEPIVFSNHFTRLRPRLESVASRFIGLWLNYLWNSRVFYNLCNKWIGQSAINKDKLARLAFPLPPLAEQYRIIEKVDKLMALCDELESRQQVEREERRRLRTASLAALEEAATAEEAERAWAHVAGEFSRLVDSLEDVAELRTAILQLAQQGSLTEQFENESAEKLYPEIQSSRKCPKKDEKIRYASSSISEDNGYSILPKNWRPCYLIEVCHEISDINHKMPPSVPNGVKFISAKDIGDDGSINLDNDIKYISQNDYEKLAAKVKPQVGDIIYTRIGSIGRCGIVRTNEIFLPSYSCCVIRPCIVNENYLSICLSAKGAILNAKQKTQGIGVPDLGIGEIKRFVIPLPPLEEQLRIVEKVENLKTLCDTLEAGIRARDAALEAFTAAACRAVLGGAAPAAAPAAVGVKVIGQQRLPV